MLVYQRVFSETHRMHSRRKPHDAGRNRWIGHVQLFIWHIVQDAQTATAPAETDKNEMVVKAVRCLSKLG